MFGEFCKYSCTLQSWPYSSRNKLLRVDRVDGCDIHRMSIFLKTFASRNQPRLNDGVQVVSVPIVIDVLDEVVWQQYVVLQCRINKGASQVWQGSSSTGIFSLDILLFRKISYPCLNWPVRSKLISGSKY